MHTFNNNQRDYTDWYTVPRFEGSLEPLMAKLFSKDIFPQPNFHKTTGYDGE